MHVFLTLHTHYTHTTNTRTAIMENIQSEIGPGNCNKHNKVHSIPYTVQLPIFQIDKSLRAVIKNYANLVIIFSTHN